MVAFRKSDSGVTLLGGAGTTASGLRAALERAPVLVCADGGADHALALGWMPDAVIGDFDSLGQAARARISPDRLLHVPDQDTTDFDKCLAHVAAPMVLALGFTGGRLDHTLASLATLARNPSRRVLLLGAEDVALLAPPALSVDLPPGMRLSLFPMAPVTGRSTGLEWPLAGLEFAPAGIIGTSNRVAARRVVLQFDAPGMMLLLPPDALDPVLESLRMAPGWD